MLNWSHLAVGLNVAGTVFIIVGMVGGVSSVRRALRQAKFSSNLRRTISEVRKDDPRLVLNFKGTPEEREQSMAAEAAAAAGWNRIFDAAGLKRGTIRELNDDPFGEANVIGGLQRQIKELVGDLVWLGTGGILTGAASVVSML